MPENYITKEYLDKTLDEKFDDMARIIKDGFDGVGERFNKVEGEISSMKSVMVTKDYLDDKLAKFNGETIVRERREDEKVNLSVKFLGEKKIFNSDELKQLHEIQVFPAPPNI